MSAYAEAVELCNAEAQYGETYGPVPGEPTLTVGSTVWFLVECRVQDMAISLTWVRVCPPGQVFRTAGGHFRDDIELVLVDSEIES